MKKRLFLIASVFAVFSLQAQEVSTVKILANTNVKVGSGTLFYVNGDMTMGTYTETGKKFSNEGNVKITKKLKTSTGDMVSFVNERVDQGKYGQLIINDGKSDKNDGKIRSILQPPTAAEFYFMPLAIPYEDITGGDVVKAFFKKTEGGFYTPVNTGKKYDPKRWNNALFFWDNDKYMFTHVSEQGDLVTSSDKREAARYYAVNAKYAGTGEMPEGEVQLDGKPVKDEIVVTVKNYDLSKTKNTDTNEYGDAYGGYITDFTMAMPQDWDKYYEGKKRKNDTDFGSRIYLFGNPYTSNIDLSQGDFASILKEGIEIEAFTQYGDNVNSDGSYGGGSFSAMTGQYTGDTYLGVVAPFGTFALKVKKPSIKVEDFKFKFTDNMKTFNMEVSNSERIVTTMFSKSASEMPVINQVGLDLYNSENKFTGVKTYVVASDIYEASQKGEGTEIYNPTMSNDDLGIYTLQEKEDGTIDEALAENKTYINGVNGDKYIAKPIHLVFQNGKGRYTLKARLNDNLKESKNSFYFEDKAMGKVTKIDENFEYTFDLNGTDRDRFVLYWAATPVINPIKVEEVNNSTTVIFKDLDTYKVRFDKSMKSADIFVYNISGQLISNAKNIDTSSDYVVPLRGNTSVYIVKIVGNNGIVITKKIIK